MLDWKPVWVAGVVLCLLLPLHSLADEATELDAIDEAMDRAAKWLAARQDRRGEVKPQVHPDLPGVLVTGSALWAVALADREPFPKQKRLRAVGFLNRSRQKDGGYYEAGDGLKEYTSSLAAAALRRVNQEIGSEQIERFAADAERFVLERWRKQAPPVDVASNLKAEELNGSERRAVDFLKGLKPDLQSGEKVAAERAPFLFTPLAKEDPRWVRAYEAARASYSLDVPSQATKSYAEASLLPNASGLYWSYLVLTRTFSLAPETTVQDAAGRSHDWPREISRRLLDSQKEDGSWDDSGENDEPVLTTSHALTALQYCRERWRK